MSTIKRKLNSNPRVKKGMKKFRNQEIISITSIENLSNEIFYEIFDYFDGCEIYELFSNLNNHFHQLLHSSSLLFKIKFDSKSNKLYKKFYKQITLLNRNQIYSLNLYLPLRTNDFFSSFVFDSSLDHLKSLTLNQLEPDLLLSVLFNLSTLPRLSSLTIDTFNVMKHATDIYRIVFTLPMLNYFNFNANNSNLFISLPTPTDQQYSPIKYLILNHCCTFAELAAIVSYTPQLRYLDYMNNNINHSDVGIILPITLSNLTHLFLCMYEIKYEEFEIFISKFDAKLKVFTFITLSEDILYFDAVRWEEIILKYLPYLQVKQFCLLYNEYIDYDYESPTHLGELDQFISPFWIERQLGYEVKTERECITYSICAYEKRWYEYHTEFDHQLSKSARLTLTDLPPLECQDLITIYINRALTVAQYYHLEIPNEQIFNGTLLEVVDLLSELQTLKIHSLSLEEPRDLCEEEVDILLSREDTNQITKVYLEIMMDMADIYFLMVLCPHTDYIKIGSIINMDVESFLREMLNKINHEQNEYLRLLCFRVDAADDQTIKNLEKMIDDEKLLVDYSMKRVRENIYLQWK